MAKAATTSKDVIQRAYLLRKLTRMRRTVRDAMTPRDWQRGRILLLTELIEWVKAQRVRSKRPGGLGK